MGDAGEVGVELRLKTGKLAQDIQRGAQDMRSKMKSGLASNSGIKTDAEIDREAKILRWRRMATESRLRDMRNARRGGPGGGSGGGAGGSGDPSSYYGFSDRAGSVLKAVAAFLALRKVINEVTSAVENAARRYSKQLTSGGMAGGFINRRESLAKIIGVSEESVMQYGSAVAYLNKQLDWSTKVFTETDPALTDTSWKFKTMGKDIEAAFASMAKELKPLLDMIAESGSKAAKGLAQGLEQQKEQSQMQAFLMQMHDEGKVTGDVGTYEGRGENGRGSGKFTFNKMGMFGPGKELPQLMEEFNKWKANLPKGTEAPAPSVSTNRMPGSAWERMGLIIGHGGASDKPATEKTLKELVSALRLAVGAGIPRTGKPIFDKNMAMP